MPAWVNGVSTAANAAVSTVTNSPSFVVTAGNLIVVFAAWSDANATCSVTDNVGNVYTSGVKLADSKPTATQMFYCANAIGGSSVVVTATYSVARDYRTLLVNQYSGIAKASPLVVAPTGKVGNSASPNVGPFDTGQDNALVVAGVAGNPATAAGSGYSLRQAVEYASAEDRIYSPASSTATATITIPSGMWVMQAMVFRAAVTAVTGTLTTTEGGDATSGAGAVALRSSSAVFENSDGASASGRVSIAATSQLSEASDAFSFAAIIGLKGLASWTESADLVSAFGQSGSGIAASVSVSEASDTIEAAVERIIVAVPAQPFAEPVPIRATGASRYSIISRGGPSLYLTATRGGMSGYLTGKRGQ